jgi:hypothetical protein
MEGIPENQTLDNSAYRDQTEGKKEERDTGVW